MPLHWEELALEQDKVPLAPQYDVYASRHAAGQVLVVTLRQDGVLKINSNVSAETWRSC